MGMTDNEFKNELRQQLDNWQEVKELLEDRDQDKAMKKILRIIARIEQSLQD